MEDAHARVNCVLEDNTRATTIRVSSLNRWATYLTSLFRSHYLRAREFAIPSCYKKKARIRINGFG
jgi:hypothetical protein